jgi:hypothetical protein
MPPSFSFNTSHEAPKQENRSIIKKIQKNKNYHFDLRNMPVFMGIKYSVWKIFHTN